MSTITHTFVRVRRPSFSAWIKKISFLTVYAAVDRHNSGWATLIFGVIEPLGIIGLLTAVNYFSVIPPAFGDSNLLFLSTGIVPFYLLLHIGIRLINLDRFVHLPHVTRFEEIIARVNTEFLLKAAFFLAMSCVLWFIGAHQWFPADPIKCVCALLSICLLGTGIGLINAVICSFVDAWRFAFVIIMRTMLIISAAHNVMDRVPPPFRTWTLYNPLSHLATWFRSGWYVRYPAQTLDLSFAAKCIAILLFLGFILEKGTRAIRDTR